MGGAITLSDGGKITFKGKADFTGNLAHSSGGGAIYSGGAMTFKDNASFEDNYAYGNLVCCKPAATSPAPAQSVQ